MVSAGNSFRTVRRGAAHFYQVLYKEDDGKAVETVMRYIKRFSAAWTGYTLPASFVFPVIFKTLQTKRMKTRKRLSILEDFKTDRTR